MRPVHKKMAKVYNSCLSGRYGVVVVACTRLALRCRRLCSEFEDFGAMLAIWFCVHAGRRVRGHRLPDCPFRSRNSKHYFACWRAAAWRFNGRGFQPKVGSSQGGRQVRRLYSNDAPWKIPVPFTCYYCDGSPAPHISI